MKQETLSAALRYNNEIANLATFLETIKGGIHSIEITTKGIEHAYLDRLQSSFVTEATLQFLIQQGYSRIAELEKHIEAL